MANWLETTPIEFTPYQGVDVDTYVKVGMAKQSQYNEGIQKIQGVLDSFAGLDLYRDKDKEVLNTLVGELTSEVNNMAGADWSDAKLINSVGALANRIAGDERIYNAVKSTQKVRSFLQSVKDRKEKNPELYPIQQEWADSQSLQAYVRGDVDVYNGPIEAGNYLDHNKALSEHLKQFKPKVITKINANGQYEYLVDKSTVLSPERIDKAVREFYQANPQYMQSLMVDAAYSFRNSQPGDFEAHFLAPYDEQISAQEAYKEYLEKAIAKNPNNASYVAPLKEKLDAIPGYITELKENKEAVRREILDPNNINSVKQRAFLDLKAAGAANKYAQHEQQLDIQANINAKTFMDNFFKSLDAGVDPYTLMPLKPGDLYYDLYQSNKKKKGSSKSTKGGSLEDEMEELGLSSVPMVVDSGLNPDKYTTDVHRDRIASIGNQIKQKEDLLRKDYFNSVPEDMRGEGNFENYKYTQESLIEEGKWEEVDDNYLQYRKDVRESRVETAILDKMYRDAYKRAAATLNMSNIDFLNPNELSWHNKNLERAINNELSKVALNYASNAYLVKGKAEDVNFWRNMIVTSEKEINKKDILGAKDELSDIDAMAIFQKDGAYYARYTLKGSTKQVKLAVNPGVALPLPSDPFNRLNNLIKEAGTSPMEGDAVLTSDNGKIRYAIQWQETSQQFVVKILDGKNAYTVKAITDPNNPIDARVRYGSVGEINHAMNEFSTMINPITKKPFTTREIIVYLSQGPEALKAMYENT